nr:MAG TPA: hypothetical protein [Caudoviricetes sp.]
MQVMIILLSKLLMVLILNYRLEIMLIVSLWWEIGIYLIQTIVTALCRKEKRSPRLS